MLTVNYPTTRPVEEDQLLLGRYQYGSEIFRGRYSRIFCMKDVTSERQCSCKRFSFAKLTSQQTEIICREADLAQKSMFPGQMKYISVVIDKRSGTLFALVDLHRYGDMRTQLDTAIMEDFFFSEDTIWMIAAQLIKFLGEYSSQTATRDTIIMDLRPSCIYISETGFVLVDTVRLARFDLFPEATDYEMPCYNAPELLAGARPFHTMDIWSLGATLFELCTRKPYITGWTRKQVMELGMAPPNIVSELTTNQAHKNSRYSRKLADFITDLLNPRADRRPSTDDLITQTPIVELINTYKDLLRIHHYKRGPRITRMSTCACGGNMDNCCGYRRYLKQLAAEPPYPRNISYTYISKLSGNTYTIVNNWACKQGKEHHRRYMLSTTFAEPRTRPLGDKRPIIYNPTSNQPSVFSDTIRVYQGGSFSTLNSIADVSSTLSQTGSVVTNEQSTLPQSVSSDHTQEIIVDDESETTYQSIIQDRYMCDQGVGTSAPVTLQDIMISVPSLELTRNKNIPSDTHRFISSPHTPSSAKKFVNQTSHQNITHSSPNFIKPSVAVAPLQPRNTLIDYNSLQLIHIYEDRPNRFREQPSSMHISSFHSST